MVKRRKKTTLEDSYVFRAYENKHDPAFLSSLTAFAKSRKNAINLKNLQKSLSKIEAYSIHKPLRIRYKRPSQLLHSPNYNYCLDLIDMQRYKYSNNNYGWILVCLDSFSRVLSLVKLKKKSGIETAAALQTALKEMSKGGKKYALQVYSDNGLEFLNKHVQAVFAKHNIHHYTSKTQQKAFMCERVIREVKSKIFKWFSLKNTKRWVDLLPQLAINHNNTKHSAHGMKPNDIKEGNSGLAFSRMYKSLIQTPRKPHKYQIGTLVRISGKRLIFRKSYHPGFSRRIFRIKAIKNTYPVYSYILETADTNELLGSSYVDSELSLYTPK